jgi:tetratricopeptide (TPR) repeat protein
MSRTLNLVDHLLSRGRKLEAVGRKQDAIHILGRLAGMQAISPAAAEETHWRLAELNLTHSSSFARARPHLERLIALCPNNARYHYHVALVLDFDVQGDSLKALDHYRKSLALDPNQPDCLGDYGLLAMSLGMSEDGLEALQRAAGLAPDDPEIIGRLIEGLCELDKTEEALTVLRAALFRNPRSSAFRKLWSDFQFQRLRESQDEDRKRLHLALLADDEPCLLPFRRKTGPLMPRARGRKVIRQDGASSPQAPHLPRPAWLPDRKHA